MTTYDYRTDTAAGTTGATSADTGGMTDQAREAAGTAAEEGRHMADVAKSQAGEVAADAKAQARNLLEDAKSGVQEQGKSQLDSLVSMLQGFAEDLEQMAKGQGPESGLAHDVVQQVGDRARSVSSQIQGREPSELLDQARDFARRRPGTFLLGALAAGMVAGRVVRGAKDAHTDSGSTGISTTGPTGTAETPVTPATTAMPSTPPPPPAPSAGPAGMPSEPGTATARPLSGLGTPQDPPRYPDGSSTTETGWGTR